MSVLVPMPDEAKALIEQLLHVQKRDGSARHQFDPVTTVANEGDWREMAAYLKETGDLPFLDQVIPYYERDRNGHPLASGTVLDHVQRAIAFTWRNVGQHGLPLLGFADWNDTVNLRAGAESLFVANLLGKALLEMIELVGQLGAGGHPVHPWHTAGLRGATD